MEKLVSNHRNAQDFIIENFGYIDGGYGTRQDTRHLKDDNVRKVLKKLNKINRMHDSRFDMHGDNFMFRGGQIVFTDPIYNREALLRSED
jgi:hypothetical protein